MRFEQSDRFAIDVAGDGWVKIERRGGDAMSVRTTELPELIDMLQRWQRESRPA